MRQLEFDFMKDQPEAPKQPLEGIAKEVFWSTYLAGLDSLERHEVLSPDLIAQLRRRADVNRD